MSVPVPSRRSAAKPRLILATLSLIVAAMVAWPAHAQALITQQFKTDGAVIAGSLVCLKSPTTVTPATVAQIPNLLGVVTSSQGNTADVATTDLVTALVSTANGNIASGSPITASNIEGFGALATASTRIIGFSEAALSPKTKGARAQTVKEKNGKTQTVYMGSVPVLLSPGFFVAPHTAAASNNDQGTGLPLGNFFDTVAGKQVASSRILLSLFLLLVVVVIIGVLVGTSVHSNMIAIGRNPLASSRLLKGLAQVIGVAVVLIIGAAFATFMIITH